MISDLDPLVEPTFAVATQNAFQHWEGRSRVRWMLARDRGELGRLDGPSLSGAFDVGLTLLYYRNGPALDTNGIPAAGLADRPRYQWDSRAPLDRFGKSVAGADFSRVAVSAQVCRQRHDRIENIVLCPVGEMEAKSKIDAVLAISREQQNLPPVGERQRIKASTVRDLIQQVFDRQAQTVVLNW
ncbi:MAG: hypothetical protein NTY38_21855 [Acidobacteria bacterium]|nr:hypothetical protein [Acidobacteriota bacterium]